MSAEKEMMCGPCFDITPHTYTEDVWKCMRCLLKKQAAALRTERGMLDLLYHSIRAGRQGKALEAAMTTVERWMNEREALP